MNEEQQQKLIARVTELESFVSGMSRRVIYARGEAMAATFCLAEIVKILSREKTIEKFSMGTALVRSDAALDKERATSDPKTQEAIDHARLLLRSMQISLRIR
ncbi:MAG TPA: hypothetical protein VIJ85_06140 [Rhizomicrobium sp.]